MDSTTVEAHRPVSCKNFATEKRIGRDGKEYDAHHQPRIDPASDYEKLTGHPSPTEITVAFVSYPFHSVVVFPTPPLLLTKASVFNVETRSSCRSHRAGPPSAHPPHAGCRGAPRPRDPGALLGCAGRMRHGGACKGRDRWERWALLWDAHRVDRALQ